MSEALFQHARDPLFLITVGDEFRYARVNPAYERTVGISAENVRGQTPRGLFGEQQGAALERRYRRCVERRNPLTYTEQLQLDETSTWWEARIVPVEVDEEVKYIAGTTRDVTQREKRKQELEQLTSQYETLVENFPGGVFLFNRNLEYIFAGGKELSAAGLSNEEFTNATPHDVFPDTIAEKVTSAYRSALSGNRVTYEEEFRNERYRSTVVPVRNDAGEVTLGIGVSQNVQSLSQSDVSTDELQKNLQACIDSLCSDVLQPGIDPSTGDFSDTSADSIQTVFTEASRQPSQQTDHRASDIFEPSCETEQTEIEIGQRDEAVSVFLRNRDDSLAFLLESTEVINFAHELIRLAIDSQGDVMTGDMESARIDLSEYCATEEYDDTGSVQIEHSGNTVRLPIRKARELTSDLDEAVTAIRETQ